MTSGSLSEGSWPYSSGPLGALYPTLSLGQVSMRGIDTARRAGAFIGPPKARWATVAQKTTELGEHLTYVEMTVGGRS